MASLIHLVKRSGSLSITVQRRFTKRLPGMKSLTYHQRLTKLDLESLELRRIRADLIFAYKLIFGPVDIDPSEFFTVRVDDARRGHRYKLYFNIVHY